MRDAASVAESLAETLARAKRLLKDAELVILANPADVTDAVRAKIEATPLTTLRESSYAPPGKFYVVRPGALDRWPE